MQNFVWLGETMANRASRNVVVPVEELVNGLKMDYKKTTNYHKIWRVCNLVRDWYLGGQRKSFHMIPTLLEQVSNVDLDAIVDLSTHKDSRVFKRAFICPGAMHKALQYCQPFVCLNACHMKNHKYPGQLFVAIALDGNMRGFTLCYAIAPMENGDN